LQHHVNSLWEHVLISHCSFWLPRRAIGYLHANQLDYFKVTPLYNDFKFLLDMALERKTYRCEYWLQLAGDAIMDGDMRTADRNSRGTSREVWTDDEAGGEDEDDSHLDGSEDEQPSRKRARTTESSHMTRSTTIPARPLPTLPGIASPASVIMARSSTAATTNSSDGGVKVKREDGEGGNDQMITVYIGMQNKVFRISREDLSQSPVLNGYVRGKPGALLVMDPELMGVSTGEFDAVDEFLKTGEFQPFYVAKEGRTDIQPGAGSLDGVRGHKQYSTQLLRLGKLYVMAGTFKLPKMQLLVWQKVVAGFPSGWSSKAMLALIGQIFQDMPGTVENAATSLDQGEGSDINDPLKDWLIVWLAEHMRTYTQALVKGIPKQYWDTLDKGVGLSLAVHRVKTQIIEKHKGELVKIEDGYESDA
jgi:hypothetical protein